MKRLRESVRVIPILIQGIVLLVFSANIVLAECDIQTITMYTWQTESPYINTIIDTFNSSQNRINVEAHYIDDARYDDEVIELLKEGKNIDLIGVRGIAKVNKMYKENLIQDLTSLIKDSNFDITKYGNMFNQVAIDGRYYALPTRTTNWILIYNKDLFDKEGIDYPKKLSWKQYRELAKTMTHGEGEEKQWGGYWVPWMHNFYGILNQNYLYDDDLYYCRQSLEFENYFYNIDQSHVSYEETAGGNEWLEYFSKSNIAMMPQGEWAIGLLMEAEKEGKIHFDWDIAYMPHSEDAKLGTTWGQYQFTAIASTTENVQAAEEFLHFIGGPTGGKIYAEHGMLSAYMNDEIRDLYMKTVGDIDTSVLFDAYRIQETPNNDKYNELNDLFSDAADQYLSGSKTLSEALDQFEIQRKKILSS